MRPVAGDGGVCERGGWVDGVCGGVMVACVNGVDGWGLLEHVTVVMQQVGVI